MDTVSIFGGIVAINREITKDVALLMKPVFLEIIMAPHFTDEALEILTAKKNLRLIEIDMTKTNLHPMQYVSVNGGILAQNTREDRVEGAHADVATATVGQHLGDSFAHLPGGLVGEGERQNPKGCNALLDHIGDARGEHARFARPRTGDDQRRAVVMNDRLPLRGVQSL